MGDSILSLLPPLVTIFIAIWRKNATIALLSGIFICGLLVANWQPFDGMMVSTATIAGVFDSMSNTYIISFSLLIGVLVALMKSSGAIDSFIESLSRLKIVRNRRHASMLPTIIGSSIFTDSSLSMFTAGMASQSLFDKYKLSRARLAYLIDSTCSPISILVLINGWGAYVLGLLGGYDTIDPVSVLIGTISYNFYAIIAVMLAYFTAYSGKVYGPMKNSPCVDSSILTKQPNKAAPAHVMWFPLIMLIVLTLALLFITGDGDIRQGSGAFSVFIAILASLMALITMIFYYSLLTAKKAFFISKQGVIEMFPAVLILVLSFAFGESIRLLETGIYISQLINTELPLFLIAPFLFIIAGLTAFSTGTSWATFAILIPIAVPIAQKTNLPVDFIVAAVLGGGIFGDHASPISDTTVVASIASGCDHFEHVKTQLPYALAGGLATLILYALIGLAF